VGCFSLNRLYSLGSLSLFSSYPHEEHNQITGIIDDGFMKNLSNLAYLDISDNAIGGDVPMHLFDLPNLLVLDLHDNNFTVLPDAIPANTNLRLLAMQKCQFSNQSIPTTISNIANLWHLDLSQNLFTGEIPEEIASLTNLTYLFLAQNDFSPSPIPSWIFELKDLQELSLKSTDRTGTIPNGIGDNLQNLILLDLDDNSLEGSIPIDLGGLASLEVLTLNRNNLISEIPASFASMTSLSKFLYCNGAAVASRLVVVMLIMSAFSSPVLDRVDLFRFQRRDHGQPG
jgi:Leucine-rich repeat (LRR) protein